MIPYALTKKKCLVMSQTADHNVILSFTNNHMLLISCTIMTTVEPLLTTTPDLRLPCLWGTLTLVPPALPFRMVLKKPVSEPPLYSV